MAGGLGLWAEFAALARTRCIRARMVAIRAVIVMGPMGFLLRCWLDGSNAKLAPRLPSRSAGSQRQALASQCTCGLRRRWIAFHRGLFLRLRGGCSIILGLMPTSS